MSGPMRAAADLWSARLVVWIIFAFLIFSTIPGESVWMRAVVSAWWAWVAAGSIEVIAKHGGGKT